MEKTQHWNSTLKHIPDLLFLKETHRQSDHFRLIRIASVAKKKLLLKAVNCKFEHNQHHIQVVKLMRTLLLGDQKDLDNKHEES